MDIHGTCSFQPPGATGAISLGELNSAKEVRMQGASLSFEASLLRCLEQGRKGVRMLMIREGLGNGHEPLGASPHHFSLIVL